MILFKVYGLDQYVVGTYSKENTENLAKLLETKEEEIMFYAPNAYIFHNGVEQTSWHATIEVTLPNKYHPLQDNVANYLINTFKLFSINVHVLFSYFDEHHLKEYFNDQYPRFIKGENLVNEVHEDVDEHDLLDEDKVYTGNIFKDFKKKK